MTENPTDAGPASITILVPGPLRDYCDGAASLRVQASDVRAALDQLAVRFPALRKTVCDETGAVRRHINLFVNSDHIRDLDGLGTALAAGDVLIILPAVSGG